MLKKLMGLVFPIKIAYAHCDIPCGIYDPHEAQLAAHSVMRMVNLINDPRVSSEEAPFEERKQVIHNISRYTLVKEEQAEKVKHEVRIIWGDFFKPEMVEKFPELHETVFKIMKASSKARQEVNPEAAAELLELVLKFSEIFYQAKGLETKRVKASFPTEGELVVPK